MIINMLHQVKTMDIAGNEVIGWDISEFRGVIENGQAIGKLYKYMNKRPYISVPEFKADVTSCRIHEDINVLKAERDELNS